MKLLLLGTLVAACGSRTGLELNDRLPDAGVETLHARFLAANLDRDCLFGVVDITEAGEPSVQELSACPVHGRLIGSRRFPLLLGERQWEPFTGNVLDIFDATTLSVSESIEFDGHVYDACMAADGLVYVLEGGRLVLISVPDDTVVQELDTDRPGTVPIAEQDVDGTACVLVGEILYLALGLYDRQSNLWLAALDTRTNEFLDLAPLDASSEIVPLEGPTSRPRPDPVSGRLYWIANTDTQPVLLNSYDPATKTLARHVVAIDGWEGDRVIDLELIGSDQGVLVVGSDTGRAVVGFDATTGESRLIREYPDQLIWAARAAFGRWLVVAGGAWIDVIDLDTGEPQGRVDLERPFVAVQLSAIDH